MNGDQIPVIIPPAMAADAGAIATRNAELCVAQNDPPSQFTADAMLRDGFGDRPEFELLVAERANDVIVYALFANAYEPGFAARGPLLSDLCVTLAARRSSVGRARLDSVVAEADRRGRTNVWWLSVPRNNGAQVFSEALKPAIKATVISRVRLNLGNAGRPAEPNTRQRSSDDNT